VLEGVQHGACDQRACGVGQSRAVAESRAWGRAAEQQVAALEQLLRWRTAERRSAFAALRKMADIYRESLLVEYLGRALPPAGSHRLYFDFGTAGLDAAYEPFQQRMDTFMRAAGYQLGEDWLRLKFEGAEHTEAAWRNRVHLPFGLLLVG